MFAPDGRHQRIGRLTVPAEVDAIVAVAGKAFQLP